MGCGERDRRRWRHERHGTLLLLFLCNLVINQLRAQSALQCVQNKKAWPTQTADDSNTPLVKDLSFVHAAFSTALKFAGKSTRSVFHSLAVYCASLTGIYRLAINDFNTGGNDAKTACMIQVLQDVNKNAGVPFNRLAVGFQSHVVAAPNQFVAKSALEANLKKLAALGANGLITELDVKLPSGTSSAAERYQAAIYGDYLDVRPDFSMRICAELTLLPLYRRACTPRTATSSSAGTRATISRGSASPPRGHCLTRMATQRCAPLASADGSGMLTMIFSSSPPRTKLLHG
jgi:hypothetical protein